MPTTSLKILKKKLKCTLLYLNITTKKQSDIRVQAKYNPNTKHSNLRKLKHFPLSIMHEEPKIYFDGGAVQFQYGGQFPLGV